MAHFILFLLGLGAILLFAGRAAAADGGNDAAEVLLQPPAFTDIQGTSHQVDWMGENTKTTIFFFFAPRAVSSIKELDFFNKINKYAGHRGLKIYAVESTGLEVEDVAWHMSRFEKLYSKPSFPVIPDPDYALSRLFTLEDVPSAFFVDRLGKVVYRSKGFNEDLKLEMTRKAAGAIRKDTEGFADTTVRNRAVSGEGAGGITLPAAKRERLKVGDKVSPFSVADLEKNLHDYLWTADDPALSIIFFWGSMCLPCMAEMTYLDELNKLPHDGQLRILAVQASGLQEKQTMQIMRRFKRFYDYPSYPLIADPGFSVCDLFGVYNGGPATFFVDRSGIVTYYNGDFVQGSKEKMREMIAEAITLPDTTARRSRRVKKAPSRTAADAIETAPSIARRIAQSELQSIRGKADRLFAEKKYEESLDPYLKCLNAKPGDVELRLRVAEAYKMLSRYMEAMEQWQQVLRYDPENREANRMLKVWMNLNTNPDSDPR